MLNLFIEWQLQNLGKFVSNLLLHNFKSQQMYSHYLNKGLFLNVVTVLCFLTISPDLPSVGIRAQIQNTFLQLSEKVFPHTRHHYPTFISATSQITITTRRKERSRLMRRLRACRLTARAHSHPEQGP